MPTKDKIKYKIKLWSKLIFNWRFLLCFGLAWVITNGWSYIALSLGLALKLKWIARIAGAYIAFLWLPITPEKFITVGLALFFVKNMFPNHNQTLKDHIMTATNIKPKDNLSPSNDATDTITEQNKKDNAD